MSSQTSDLTFRTNSQDTSSFIHTVNPPKLLTKIITNVMFKSETQDKASLHDQARKLSYFSKLHSCNINENELLLNFANDSKIFHKFEEIIRTKQCYQDILHKDICRYEQVEKDIQFFIEKFNLLRPQPTQEVYDYLEFIDNIVEENINFLPILLFVQYGGLFLGRATCNATINWLTKRLDRYDPLIEDNGVSYWNFNGRNPQELTLLSTNFYNAVDEHGKKIEIDMRVHEITKKAFQHIYSCVESSCHPHVPQIPQEDGNILQPRRYHMEDAHDSQVVKLVLCYLMLAVVIEYALQSMNIGQTSNKN